jgi:site-specific recombinase XerD
MGALAMDVPLISIIVRHSEGCKYKDERTYKRCDCKKWLEYFHKGKQHRVSAKTRSWTIAEEAKRTLEEQFKNGVTAPGVVASGGRKTVKDKVALFITMKQNERVSASVLRKYRHELDHLEAFLSKQSKFYPEDITADDLVTYRATWNMPTEKCPEGLAPRTQQKRNERLRSFLRFACDAKALADLLKAVKGVRVKAKSEPHPFTDAELTRLLAQVPVTFPDEPRRSRIIALIHLMVGTGLAIVDAGGLKKENFKNGWLNVTRQKTGTHVELRLDSALLKELQTVTNGNPEYVFWNDKTKLSSLTGIFQANLRDVMKDAKVYIKGDLSHRFRDTFAKFLFDNGCSVTQVAEAMGDTEEIVLRHYRGFAGQERLAKLPQRMFHTQA